METPYSEIFSPALSLILLVAVLFNPIIADGVSNIHYDPDNDGLSQTEEQLIEEKVEGAEPNSSKKDIIIEIDYHKGEKPSSEVIKTVEKVFESAPVENPDGTNGFNVHILVDESFSGNGAMSFNTYEDEYYPNLYDYGGRGAYHVLLVEEVEPSEPGVIGVAGAYTDGTIVDGSMHDEKVAQIIIHELGHQLGLSSNDYTGIDSDAKTYDEYPSIMNYNGFGEDKNLSSGEGFDDWEHIENSLPFTAPSTSSLTSGAVSIGEVLKIHRRRRIFRLFITITLKAWEH